MSVHVYRFDPLVDPRWTAYIQNSGASVFHTPEWLNALRRTYDYEPGGLTCSAPGEPIDNGLVFCRVRSWVTGRRLVSLPFSDHCQPLAANPEQLKRLVSALADELRSSRGRYIEIRPQSVAAEVRSRLGQSDTYCAHCLDLTPTLDEIYHRFHKDCVQRKIRRAERERLTYEVGTSDELLAQFYDLLVLTRRRHGAPAQPFAWYRNLIACMAGKLKIRVAFKDGHPIASILTLQHSRTLMYKYGASDARYHNLGGMQALLWKAIQDGKGDGLREFDLGRSDWNNPGLIEFKKRWGAVESDLHYLRYPVATGHIVARSLSVGIVGQLVALAPTRLVTMAARVVYKHLG